jgi:cell division septation protein DedD
LQTDLTKRISTNNDDITTISTNMATADRGEKKRLESFLGEVTAERNGNVRTLGEEKQRFYAELDKSKHDDIAKTSASTDYTNRYADYRQSLYSLTNADPSSADMTEKLADAEKSEYALLQTIIPNVDSETKSVLMPIYNGLDEKYGNLAASTSTNQQSGVEGKNNENPTSSPQSLQHSVTLQTDLTKRISTNNDDITTIATNMATADRGEKKRLETFLGEVTAERNDNVRTLGEEKQRFYAELDKSKHDDIAKTSASTDYTNRYADYRQSLYTLTNAEQSGADMSEKMVEAEKSEYALLQTIIPNVDAETKSVLMPIYNSLDAKYSNEVSLRNDVAEAKDVDITKEKSQELLESVSRQASIATRIATSTSEINTLEGIIGNASNADKKRLETQLGEVKTERDGNVRTLSEEKERFYAEIDKVSHYEISQTDVSAEYTNRYADYRQLLQSLRASELSGDNVAQKLAKAELSEYALLQTIIPNVDAETKSILQPIYNSLEAKYGSKMSPDNMTPIANESYSRSMDLQEQMVRNIEISTKEIERLEQRKDGAKKSEQRRIADDIAREESQKLDDIQKLAVEKSKFYSELNSSLETILPTLSDSARQEYKLAYDSYDETLRTMKIGLGFYDMSVANKIYSDSEIQEYKLLQQMSQVATGESKTVVDNMIGRMEANNSTLKRYKVVVDYVIVENTVSNASTNSNVAEKRDSVSLNIPDSNSTILASVDSAVVVPKKKSMSGFSSDSYGIFEKPEINMGLYYRIQIVAANVKYRMPYFNGLSLIFTEQIPNTNIIRYMTGEYYRYVSAREDLPKVRGLGFSDAFIVAYYNGKRISIGEARRLEALQNAEENEEIPIVIRHEAPADYVEPESIIASSQTKSETIANAENGTSVANNYASGQNVTEGNSAVSSENVAINGQIVSSGNVVDSQAEIAVDSHEIPSKGVYYAVQIGVYKDRRGPWQLRGVYPISYETMPNGLIRHTSGRFANYETAKVALQNIRSKGVTDAFVVAYIDGRKVSFNEGIEYQKSMSSRVIAENNTENTSSQTQSVSPREENLSNVEYAPLNLSKGTEENNKEGISYYVQIGAFSKSPDPEILSVFSKVAGDKIHVKFPREGLQVYRIGVFSSYEEAQNTLAEARSFGIVDAFIVAFKGEEQISSSEAIRLQNAVRKIEGNSGETINSNAVQKSSTQNVQPISTAEPKPVVPAETLQQAEGGVEYFVQLGAFVHTPDTRSMATFRSIASSRGSSLTTVQNGRFTNYRVGAFKKFDDVKAAVENARSMGVTDAFVVAFYNGERIPVVEAKEKE